MCDLYICRICLIHGIRGEKMTKTLQLYYEELTNTIISEQDELPKWLCFECTSLLRKYHKFREKCCHGQTILGKILWKGQITLETIDLINRYNEKLTSALSYPTTNNHIKTYEIKHKKVKTIKKSSSPEKISNPTTDIIKIENNKTPTIEAVYVDKNSPALEDKFFSNLIRNKDVYTSSTINNEDNKPGDLTDNQIINSNNHVDTDYLDNKINNDDYIDNSNPSDDENIFLDIVKKAVSGENKLVFIDDLKKKHQKSKRKTKKSNVKLLKSDKLSKYMKVKKQYLTPEFWEQIKLTEEEAIEEFKKKEFSSKYVNAKYKCTNCFKVFSTFDIMDRHIKLHHDLSRGPLECRFCHMRVRIKCMLAKHLMHHYTIFNCLRCNRRFNSISSATVHDEYHNGIIKKCKYCGQTFAHNSTYYTHVRVSHRSEHVCALCGASFVSEAGIAQHQRIKHIHDQQEVDPSCRDHYCEKCDVNFLNREAYDAHLIHSMMHEDQANEKRVKTVRYVEKKGRIPTTCKHCGKHFSTMKACLQHHAAEHPKQCRLLAQDRHICEICGASLAAASITSHMNTHTRAVTFSCDVCGMQFTSKSSQQRHQVTHTGERPFPCPLCEKKFTQKNSMQLHYRTFHLKQPYPKRNRRKKTDEVPLVESFREQNSDAVPPTARWR